MENKPSLKEELIISWEEFVSRCTTHGIMNIHQNKAYFFKVMWLIMFLGMSSFSFYLIVSAADEYLKYEVTTKIKIVPQNRIQFPTLKICDMNPFSTQFAKKQINEYFNASGLTSPFNITTSSKKYMRGLLNFYRDLVNKRNIHLSKEEKKNLGIEFEQILISCSFGNLECLAENFTWSYDDSSNGNCYVFNSGFDSNGSKIPVLLSTQSGTGYSFRLEMILPPPDTYYLDMLQGIRMYIGDSTMEYSKYEHVGLSPGSMTFISMKKTVSKALPKPFSDCNPGSKYSQSGCVDKCYASSSTKYCNCSATSGCFTLEQVKCEHEFRDKFFNENFQNDACSRKCTSKCEQTVYDLIISSFDYPSDNYARNMIDNKDFLFKNQEYAIDSEYLKRNMVGVLVYWKNLEYTLIEESPTTTELGLIANIGGLLGMFKSLR
jgi:hypothetical protein